jgi:uncharacterized protein YbjT (DUF2867 family)
MKALVIGATGATGKDLVQVLLQDPEYTQVTIFVRRSSGRVHPKLVEVLTDFDRIENVSAFIQGDLLFSCIGTTRKAAGSKERQWYIDCDIPAAFAEKAKQNGVSGTILLSAFSASATSKLFYSRMKGTLEEKIALLSFHQYIIFRPGLLLRENTDRVGERIGGGVLKFLNTLGLVRKFRPLPTFTLAQKMAKAPKVLPAGTHYIGLDKIFSL